MNLETISPQTVRIEIDGNLYSEQVIYKCFYWYGKDYEVSITKNANLYTVRLTSLATSISDAILQSLRSKIAKDLVDFKTREIIHNETNNIKHILIAKAFSSLEEYDEPLKGELTDPVGFKLE